MKKIVAILMAMLMVMSVTVVLASAGGITTTKEEQAEKNDLQIFENKELNVLGEVEFVAGEILVKFEPGVGEEKIDKINSKHGALVRYTSPYTGTKRIGIPKGKTVPEMVKLYQAEDVVEYAKPNYICRASFNPNDPYYSYQWHFPLIDMPLAWDIQPSGDPGIVVAVLDTGVAYEDYEEPIPGPGKSTRSITYALAPDLAGTPFVAGYDFVNDDDHPNDDNAHGTHVTGTIAQTTDNEFGVAGMAFGTSIMPVKVLDKNGGGTSQSLAGGLYYAADNGADVISMSLGFGSGVTPDDIPDVTDAVAYASGKGVILVASSGNDGGNVVSLPAAYPDVIAVGAVHSGDERASYSQYGSALEVVAPGGDGIDRDDNDYMDGVLQQTFSEGNPTDLGFWLYTGTSMAAPHVSGLVALLLAQDETMTQAEIREILHGTSVDLGTSGWDEEYGYGRIDAYAALQWTETPNDPPVAYDQSVTTDEDTPVSIILTATDPDGNDLLTYSIVSGPSHGSLSGTAPDVTYTPNANYNGGDSFEFSANDGKADSNIATVSITVNPVNDAPVADDQSVTTTQDIPVGITLTAIDVDGDTLDYFIVVYPSYGSLSGTAPSVTYTPGIDYTGPDSFTFNVHDGTVYSNTATVFITVNSAAPTMHVASIEMSTDSRSAGKNTFVWAVATVTIVDESDSPVEGALVSGHWSDATTDSDSGVTDASGQVSLKSDSVKNPSSVTIFTFTVDNVAKDGWTYDQKLNEVTDNSTSWPPN